MADVWPILLKYLYCLGRCYCQGYCDRCDYHLYGTCLYHDMYEMFIQHIFVVIVVLVAKVADVIAIIFCAMVEQYN